MYEKKVLFICLGNICRSPAAEGIFKHLVNLEKLENKIFVDSAGLIGYHTGECADPRMIATAKKRGYKLESVARKFNPVNDFENFDYIITMDNDNYARITQCDNVRMYGNKIFKMTSFSTKFQIDEVPDPYYKGQDGFEYVLDILEDACSNLLKKIKIEIES